MKQRYIIKVDNWHIRSMEPEDYHKLQKCIHALAQWPDPKDVPYHVDDSHYEVDLDEIIDHMPDLQYKVMGKVYLSDNKVAAEVHEDIVMVKETLSTLGQVIDAFSRERDMLNFNLGKNPVVINVQNDKLLAINDLIELPEAEYNEVQDKLDRGWMIITTYVDRTMGENGDAKPTYVLGIHNSALNAKEVY